MPETHTHFSYWRKSSRSNGQNGQCVEVGFTSDGAATGIRDTKDRSYGTLAVSADAWAAFLANVKTDKING